MCNAVGYNTGFTNAMISKYNLYPGSAEDSCYDLGGPYATDTPENPSPITVSTWDVVSANEVGNWRDLTIYSGNRGSVTTNTTIGKLPSQNYFNST